MLAIGLVPLSISDRPDSVCTPDKSGTSVKCNEVSACGANSSMTASCKPCTRNGGGTTPAGGNAHSQHTRSSTTTTHGADQSLYPAKSWHRNATSWRPASDDITIGQTRE
jgi:hypothetical protein